MGWKGKPFSEIYDGEDNAPKIDHPLDVRGRMRQRRGGDPSPDLADRHDVEGELLVSKPDRQKFCAPA
jgi:hypothetical protein